MSKRKLSAGSGSDAEEKAKKRQKQIDDAKQLIQSIDEKSIISYTDGSCKKPQGPCGSAAVVCFRTEDGQQIEIERYIPIKLGTNQIAELKAIDLSLKIVQSMSKFCAPLTAATTSEKPLVILTDSMYSMNVLDGTWAAKANVELIESIQSRLASVREGQTVTIHWVKGHVGIKGNERADVLANCGVEDASKV